MTAFMNNKFRVSTIYRNQWQTVSPGYNTFFAGFEFQPWVSTNESKGLGLGVCFTNDVAGSLSFGERDIAFSGSYFFSPDRYNRYYIAFGIQGMRKNWSMNLINAEFNREMTYDDNIRYDNLNTYDFSLGITLQYSGNNNNLLNIGLACFHINQPQLSYFADNSTYMHRRISAQLSYMFPAKYYDNISLNPQLLLQHQHNYNEILAGGDIIVNLNNTFFTDQVVSAGIYLRNLDAIVICPKYKYNDFTAGIAYDVNISKLSKVSNTYGAVELWLSYSFNPIYYKQKTTKIPCPIF